MWDAPAFPNAKKSKGPMTTGDAAARRAVTTLTGAWKAATVDTTSIERSARIG